MPTPGMEDHLEQIYLLSRKKGYTRVSDVAEALSVNTSSASKMTQKLGKSGYVVYEKYGQVSLTGKGLSVGKQLLDRHQLLERFLRQIGVSEDQIVFEVEQVEHHISWSTIGRINELVCFFEKNPGFMREFQHRNEGECLDKRRGEGGAG